MKAGDNIKVRAKIDFETMIAILDTEEYEDHYFEKGEIIEGKFFGYPTKAISNKKDTNLISIKTELYIVCGLDKEWVEVI